MAFNSRGGVGQQAPLYLSPQVQPCQIWDAGPASTCFGGRSPTWGRSRVPHDTCDDQESSDQAFSVSEPGQGPLYAQDTGMSPLPPVPHGGPSVHPPDTAQVLRQRLWVPGRMFQVANLRPCISARCLQPGAHPRKGAGKAPCSAQRLRCSIASSLLATSHQPPCPAQGCPRAVFSLPVLQIFDHHFLLREPPMISEGTGPVPWQVAGLPRPLATLAGPSCGICKNILNNSGKPPGSSCVSSACTPLPHSTVLTPEAGGFSPGLGDSSTPAGCPSIELDSDTTRLERASSPTG